MERKNHRRQGDPSSTRMDYSGYKVCTNEKGPGAHFLGCWGYSQLEAHSWISHQEMRASLPMVMPPHWGQLAWFQGNLKDHFTPVFHEGWNHIAVPSLCLILLPLPPHRCCCCECSPGNVLHAYLHAKWFSKEPKKGHAFTLGTSQKTKKISTKQNEFIQEGEGDSKHCFIPGSYLKYHSDYEASSQPSHISIRLFCVLSLKLP